MKKINIIFILCFILIMNNFALYALSSKSIFREELDLSKALTFEDLDKINPDEHGIAKKQVVFDDGRSVVYHADKGSDPDFIGYQITIRDTSNYHYYAFCCLDDAGKCTLIVKVRNIKKGVEIDRSSWRGKELIALIFHYFGDRIQSIQAAWADEKDSIDFNDNLRTVNQLTSRGISLENAIRQTWTSKKVAFRYGYTHIPEDEVIAKGNPGDYTEVCVHYHRSVEFLRSL